MLITVAAAAENPPARYIRDEAVIKYAENVVFEQITQHPAWKNTPAYTFLSNVKSIQDIRQLPHEKGSIQYLYDEHYLYVRAEFADSDIVNTAEKSGGHLYSCGDLLEVFIKPLDQPYYWEIYGTPNNLTSCFYFPSGGTLGLPGIFGPTSVKISVTSSVDGTFNNWKDRDKGWKTLIRIPLAELCKNGMKFAPGEKWTIFIARYNYSRFLPTCEYSGVPQKFAHFHVLSDYAKLIIKSAE